MIYIDYPNEGLYVEGKPRFVIADAQGKIQQCRFATDAEALQWALITSLNDLQQELQILKQVLLDTQATRTGR